MIAPDPRRVCEAPRPGLAARVRSDFPFLVQNLAGPGCIYLDNAATSLRPQGVIDRLSRFYAEVSSNVRGTHLLAETASRQLEEARASVAELVGTDPGEVVFTGGCTAAINLVAGGLDLGSSAVAVSLLEHHANCLPWMNRRPVRWFDPVRAGPQGLDDLLAAGDVGMVALSACSNVSGVILPVAEYVEVARRRRVPILIDAAQLAPHAWWELAAIDADYLTFSPHKMCGPFGIGALCGRRGSLDRLAPPWLGGGTVEEVTCASYRLREVPARLEPGTPPIPEALGLGEAIRYLRALGPDRVAAAEDALTARLQDRLRAIPGLGIVDPEWAGRRAPVFGLSFRSEEVGAEMLARMLFDRYGICSRAGHQCAHPYHTARGLPGTLRLSAAFYNTIEEIDRACDALEELVLAFG